MAVFCLVAHKTIRNGVNMKKPTRQGTYKGGIWTPTFTGNNPSGINKHTKKVEIMPKPLTKLQKYQKICELNTEILKFKTEWQELRKKYLGLAQKIGSLQQKQQGFMK